MNETLRCPDDGASLAKVDLRGTPVNVCRTCGGTFLDASALDDIIRDSAIAGDIPPDMEEAEDRKPEDGSQKHRKCPRCGAGMATTQFLSFSKIYLDRCIHCNGVWTDRGEVRAVVDHVAEKHKAVYEATRAHDASMNTIGVEIARAVHHRHKMQELANLGTHMSSRATITTILLPKIILPLRSDAKESGIPPMTAGIILTNILIFVLQLFFVTDFKTFFSTFGLVSSTLLDGPPILTLISSMFLHGGFFHLFGNMLYLWVFGCAVEQTLNARLFLAWYLIAGICAGLAHTLMNIGMPVPMIGASGAISGIMGTYIVLYPSSTIETFIVDRVVDVPAWIYLGIWIGFQVLMASILTAVGVCCGVAWAAHIGGFGAGVALAFIAKRLDARTV